MSVAALQLTRENRTAVFKRGLGLQVMGVVFRSVSLLWLDDIMDGSIHAQNALRLLGYNQCKTSNHTLCEYK